MELSGQRRKSCEVSAHGGGLFVCMVHSLLLLLCFFRAEACIGEKGRTMPRFIGENGRKSRGMVDRTFRRGSGATGREGAKWASGGETRRKMGTGKKERRIRPGELSEPSRRIASVLSCRPEMRRSAKEICAQSPARNREKWTRVERGWGLEAYQLVEGVVVFICCVVTAPNGVAEGLFLGQGRMVMIYRKGRIHREVVHYRLSVELNSVKTGSDIDFHT